MALLTLTLTITFLAIPETHTREKRRRAALYEKRAARLESEAGTAVPFMASLPHPLVAFGTLLFVNLSMVFAWFFVDPQLPFYAFDELDWSTAQFGAVISCYGWATLIGSLTLGRSSDRFGRKPILIFGLILHSAQYGRLMLTDARWAIIGAFVVAGLGEALVNPALSAAYLDITPEEHRSWAMGIKTAVGSLGSLLAPALVREGTRSTVDSTHPHSGQTWSGSPTDRATRWLAPATNVERESADRVHPSAQAAVMDTIRKNGIDSVPRSWRKRIDHTPCVVSTPRYSPVAWPLAVTARYVSPHLR